MKKQKPEAADPLEVAEQRHRDLMSSADAPSWARVELNTAHAPAPSTREDVNVRLAQLKTEEDAALKALAETQAKQRDILNQQLDAQRAAEKAAEDLTRVPEQLAETMETIRGFVGTEPVSTVTPGRIDYAARGAEALSIAQRRSRGEVVPEPVYDDVVPTVPGESTRQAQLRQRCAQPLADAEARRQELTLWERKIGPSLEPLHVRRGEEESMVKTVNELMRGIPPTEGNIAFVQALIRTVQGLVETKSVMAGTVSRETTAIAGIIARCDSRGPMVWQGDHSAAYFALERDIVGALTRLATVTPNGVAGLWIWAQQVAERLKKLAQLRAENAGTAVAPVVWESKGETADRAGEAQRMLLNESGKPTRAITGGPFDERRG